jgi:predicted helicase
VPGTLFSNKYREKYSEFLRFDFPRIPFTSEYDLFLELGELGKKLAGIHLMKSQELDQTFSRFDVSGDNAYMVPGELFQLLAFNSKLFYSTN